MRVRQIRVLLASLVGAFFLSAVLPSSAAPAEAIGSSADRAVTLTIFQDFATVRDVRTLRLSAGMNHIAFPGISPMMSPQTAFFTDVASNHPLWISEQNFSTNLVNASSLLQAYVGRTVTVIETNPTTGRSIRENAQVLSADGPILKFADRIETSLPPFGRIVYPSIPSGLITEPSLEADIGSTGGGSSRIALTYVTDGFGWSTDYIARFDANLDRLDIDALATVSNNSGADYPNATLQLVSGNVQRAAAPIVARQMLGAVKAESNAYAVAAGTVSRQPLLEFYLYRVPRATTLQDKHLKQFTLFSAQGIPVHEAFEVHDSGDWYISAVPGESPLEVDTFVDFTNSAPALGIPLPSGVVHMYKNDDAGISEFVGETPIDRTPRQAPVRLGLGQSTDISAKHVQTDFHRATFRVIGPPKPSPSPQPGGPLMILQPAPAGQYVTYDDSSHRITLSNAKSKAMTVAVFEDIPGEWSITSENVSHVKVSSGEVKWTLSVPANGSTTLTYSVRMKE